MCIKIWQNNYEVRKHILLYLLTYTENKNIANVPEGVRYYLQHYIRPCLVPKIFQDFSSHRMFGHMHEALNVDERKN
jgi:hypothetical protein